MKLYLFSLCQSSLTYQVTDISGVHFKVYHCHNKYILELIADFTISVTTNETLIYFIQNLV